MKVCINILLFFVLLVPGIFLCFHFLYHLPELLTAFLKTFNIHSKECKHEYEHKPLSAPDKCRKCDKYKF